MYHTKLVNAVVQMTIDLVRRKAKESLLVFYYAELSSRLQFAVFGDCFFATQNHFTFVFAFFFDGSMKKISKSYILVILYSFLPTIESRHSEIPLSFDSVNLQMVFLCSVKP